MDYGFTITKQGWKLLAKLLTGSQLEITRVMVGSGKVPAGANPGEMMDLVQPVVLATSSVPQVENEQVSFIVEYRSDLNGGLKEGFWLNEFGVFANDPDAGEVLLYYATMGDYPQYVSAFTGGSVDIRRYPVSIALSESPEVHLDYPAGALVTGEKMEEALDKQGVPAGGLEGQMLIKANNQDYVTEWGPWLSNPNLLLNWDFRNPVNRNGQSVYNGNVGTLDMWFTIGNTADKSVTIENGYISFKSISNDGIQQFIQNFKLLSNHTITLSILCKSSSAGLIRMIYDSGTLSTNIPVSDKWILVSFSGKLPNLDNATNLRFQIGHGVDTGIVDVVGVKLELGSLQTLAHKLEDETVGYDGWVLNDPPNYDLQYALCGQYGPVTGEFVGSQHSNPNLLDNWYLADPINQRGQTEYSAGYTIDRWVTRNFSNDATCKVGTTSEGLKLELLKTPNSHCALVQIVENTPFYIGKQVTFSVLCKTTGSIKFVPLMKQNQNSGQFKIGSISYDNEWCCLSCTGIVPDSASALTCFMQTEGGEPGDSVTVIAAKLELGSVQTLAHKEGDTWVLNDPPPNKALELAKCQRYQVEMALGNKYATIGRFVASNATTAFAIINTPMPIRINPTLVMNDLAKFNIAAPARTDGTMPVINNIVVGGGGHVSSGLVELKLTGTGLIPGVSYIVQSNTSNALFLLDANL